MSNDVYFKPGVVAEILNVSIGTVRNYSDRGFFGPVDKSGCGHRRILRSGLVDYLEREGNMSLLHEWESSNCVG